MIGRKFCEKVVVSSIRAWSQAEGRLLLQSWLIFGVSIMESDKEGIELGLAS